MQNLRTVAVILGVLVSTAVGAKQIATLPRDLEMQLAASALPPHLRNNATLYVLNPQKGFEVARKGTNGFHALVARTGDDAFRGSWPLSEYRDDVLYPISFDQAGSTAAMRVFIDAAQEQAKGTPAPELKKLIKERYKTGHYKPPERAGISFMLSPILRTYVDPEQSDEIQTLNHPHVMYYAPNVSYKDIGSADPGGMYPHLIVPGAHGFIVQAVGAAEKAAITREYAEMLQKLCKMKQAWCVPAEQSQH